MTKTRTLELLLLLGGLFGFLFGFIHLLDYLNNGIQIKLFDAIFNSTIGFLDLASYYFLKSKSRKAVLLLSISIFLVLMYSPLVGRGIGQNLVSVIFTGWILYQLLKLIKSKYLE